MDSIVLKEFDSDSAIHTVQTITVDDVMYFRAKDIADLLGYSIPSKAVGTHIDDEYKSTLGGLLERNPNLPNRKVCQRNEKNTIFITELGAYSLIMNCKNKESKEFQKWVFSEVLPSLRTTGSYTINRNILELKNENALHWKVVQYMRKYYPDILLIPGLGENQTTQRLRIDSWRKGYIPGSPDLIIPVPNKNYHGFALEFKTPLGTGRLSENQELYLNNIQMFNYKTLVSYDYDEICRSIADYMNSVKFSCMYCKKNRYAHSFQSKESLHTHIRTMHRIDPLTHEKLQISYNKPKPVEDQYVLLGNVMYKVLTETTRRCRIKRLTTFNKLERDVDENISEVAVMFNPSRLVGKVENVEKDVLQIHDARYLSEEDVVHNKFTFYRLSVDGRINYTLKDMMKI